MLYNAIELVKSGLLIETRTRTICFWDQKRPACKKGYFKISNK